MDKAQTLKPERIVLSECLIELSRLGARCWRNNTGMLYNSNGTPVKYGLVGSSDILGIYKSRMICVEVKATGKRVKPNSAQDKFLKMIRSQGGIAFECDDAKKIKSLLDSYM